MASMQTLDPGVKFVCAVIGGLLSASLPTLAVMLLFEISSPFREHLVFAALFFPIGLGYVCLILSLTVALFALGFAGVRNLMSRL